MRKLFAFLLISALLLSPAADAALSAAPEAETELLTVDQSVKTIALSRPMTLREFLALVGELDARPCRVFDDNGELKWESAIVLPGFYAVLAAEGSGKPDRYTLIPTNLLAGKHAEASSCEKGSRADKAIDGSQKSRWTAYDNHYPQSITVDLGSVMYLDTLTINWHAKNYRHYSYLVEVSENGKDFVLAADCRQNWRSSETCDELRWIRGRYLRINVLACSDPSGYAAILEMNLDGWSIPPENSPPGL